MVSSRPPITGPIELGEVHQFHGQQFVIKEIGLTYTKANGEETTLLLWGTACRACGCPIEEQTGSHAGPKSVRCKECYTKRRSQLYRKGVLKPGGAWNPRGWVNLGARRKRWSTK